jgi:hypothetical protein
MSWYRTTIRPTIPILFALAAYCSAAAHCQDSSDEFSNKVRIVPAPVEPAPFAPSRVRRNPVYSVKFENADHLTHRDRLLVANAESTIGELARSAGLEYSQNEWDYREITCPSFTNHVFLQFNHNNGRRDVSVYSASIPRNGVGKIRIIPILKRSYSLFSPAPINAMTVSAFNHIRAEEGQAANDDWLGNALCYAALAGAQPRILSADSWPSTHSPVPPLTAALDVRFDAKGQEVISFDDVAASTHPMEWTMTFTRDGKLIKATHNPAAMLRAQPIPETSAVVRSRQVP